MPVGISRASAGEVALVREGLFRLGLIDYKSLEIRALKNLCEWAKVFASHRLPMNITQFLLSALSAGFAAGSLFAAYPGAKSNVTLMVTATSEYGGFLVKDSVIEAQTEHSPVRYLYQLNPLGYEPALTNPANYYVEKEAEKSKTYGSGDDALTLITERVVDAVVKLKTQKFTNLNFIQELIERDLVPISSATGYKLVLVQAADRAESDGDSPILFFIENGASIHYVGRQANYWEDDMSSRDALVLSFEDVYAESFTYRQKTTFKHASTSEGVEEDMEGVTTVSETFKGTDLVHVGLFPGYYDEFDQYVSTEGVSFDFTGHLNYNGRYDAKNDQYLISSAKLVNIPGGFEEEYETEDDYGYTNGVATLSMSVAGSQVVADITPYLNALPEELAELKQEIIDSYSESSGDE